MEVKSSHSSLSRLHRRVQHTGGGRQMVAERVRFRDLDRPPNQMQEVQNELR